MRTLWQNCSIIVGDGTVIERGHLLFDDQEILSVGESGLGSPGDGGVTVDMQGSWVMPGLWTVHTHLGDIWPNPDPPYETVAERTVRAGMNALEALRCGVTSLRVAGERDYIDVAWKRAFAQKLFLGPTVYACGSAILPTAGHLFEMHHTVEVDGPIEMRHEVRDHFKNGVDQIKLYITGGEVAIEQGSVQRGEVQMTADEIRSATEVAHAKGGRVCAHTGTSEGVRRAVENGVDCIEHGYELDDETITLMVERGTFLTPTIGVTTDAEYRERTGMIPDQAAKAEVAGEGHRRSMMAAFERGVRLVCGGDNNPVGWVTHREIELMVAAGLPPAEAIRAATANAADLMGVLDRVGTLEPGKQADLLALAGNPLADITNTKRIEAVVKGGHSVDLNPAAGTRDFWSLFYGYDE